jgi:hypothetical protein
VLIKAWGLWFFPKFSRPFLGAVEYQGLLKYNNFVYPLVLWGFMGLSWALYLPHVAAIFFLKKIQRKLKI